MKHLPSNFRWSFSKIASFHQCPMSFYLTYVENPGSDDELPGYFSEYGSLMHSILEQYYKGDLPEFCLADEWRSRYESEVVVAPPPFPKNFGEKNYDAAINYLENFSGLPDGYEVMSVEKKFVIDIGGYQVSGIADLVIGSQDEVIIVDHKTKSATSMKKEYQLYRKQLYLYAIWFKEWKGFYPTKLRFNMVKDCTFIDEDFDESMVEETKQWFIDGIHAIEECDIFEDWTTCIGEEETKEPYFCKWICGCNPACNDYQRVHQYAVEAWKAKKEAEEAAALGY
jgi:RecB family exonuclease